MKRHRRRNTVALLSSSPVGAQLNMSLSSRAKRSCATRRATCTPRKNLPSLSSSSEAGPVEVHPVGPYVTPHTRVILCGSFMPLRRQMPFYYPNPSNDMWSILGDLFFGDKTHFYLPCTLPNRGKRFDVDAVMRFVASGPVGFCDVAHSIQRREGSAADDNLVVVQPTNVVHSVLTRAPQCRAIVATGALAMAHLLAQTRTTLDETNSAPRRALPALPAELAQDKRRVVGGEHRVNALPPMGACVIFSYRGVSGAVDRGEQDDTRTLEVCRAPSTSRAYPMRLDQKISMYRSIMQRYCDVAPDTGCTKAP